MAVVAELSDGGVELPEERRNLVYSRPDNPAYAQAEAMLAALDGGVGAALFSSGMAAAAAMLGSLLKVGDRLVAPTYSYFAMREFFKEHCEKAGIVLKFFDSSQEGSLEAAIGVDNKTKLVWVETPANPSWTVTDIRRAAAAAHAQGASLCVDATVLTPLICRPIEFGADFVMHSATKYLNGHSDVVAGAIVTAENDAKWAAVKRFRALNGAVLGSFESWLLLRGMRTLHVRLRRQCESAMILAKKLQSHPKVLHVLYPGLVTHPMHAISVEQQSGTQRHAGMFGGMMSIRVAGGAAAALEVLKLVRIWVPATSLGGVESLIEHRATVEGPNSGTPDDLLRLSVGLEDVEDLYYDLDNALTGKRNKRDRKPKTEHLAMTLIHDLRRGSNSGQWDAKPRSCVRGCKGLVPMADRSTHCRVMGRHFCARSDGDFRDWLRAKFPEKVAQHGEAWLENKVQERPVLKWGNDVKQMEGLPHPPIIYSANGDAQGEVNEESSDGEE